MHWRYRNFWIFFGLALILSLISNGLAEQRVVCYYTNWSVYRPGTAKFTPQNINPYLCTHLIYAFGGFTKENTLKPFDKYQDIEKGGYAKFTGLKTYNKNLKTMLAIGGWNEGSTRFSPMVADSDRRREFVKNSVKFLRQNHFDGLDLDWEYPAFRDGGKPRDKDNYADLVQELREEFERESSKTGRPRLLLSMAIPAGIEYLEKGYDLPRLNEYLDFFNLLSYDYHSAFEPAVNHHAPLYGLEEDNEYNYDSELTIDYTISYLIRHDVSSDKIVLGIPTYGRSYTLFNIDATEIGSPADGPGEEGDATREKGYLAYYEICENIAKSDDWKVVQPNTKAMGPYAFKDNQWVGYDDEDIVKVKASYVNEKKLGGIMFWSIDNDDFRGKCHGRSYPLIEAAKEAMLTENGKTKAKPSGKDGRHRLQADSPRRFRGSTSTVAPTRRRPSSDRFNSRSRSRTSGEQSDKARNDKDRGYARVTTPKSRPRLRPSTRSNRVNGRKKPDTRDDLNKDRALEKSHQTTPEPPTTPDPGTDFKCEDEGFFSHPRDCKKYFWCLDAGPGGLGIVAHQFTCPSGLVFNKLADSCDYPRNVVCPKAKPAGTTTKAPTTTSTVRTTTTPEPDSAEEYEYEDENLYSAEEIEEENTVKSTTAKPLIYKSISRARPTTTTTTTHLTTLSPSTPRQKTPVDILADEEDPRVIKELIELIKKAGGIEQLEKQLHLQDKDTDMLDKDPELITPATISRSLYERVLSRQATAGLADFEATPDPSSATTLKTTTAKIRYLNGPGGAQFAGLDDIPEVQSLRRISKPQYVTIERQRTKAEPEEDIQQDSSDIALSENQAVGQISEHNEDVTKSGPSYVNIRRFRPTTFTNDNDLEETASTPTTSALISESPNGELKQESSPPKSRYTNIARFRSTTKSSTSTMASENPQLKENHDIPETTTPLTIDEKTSDSPLTNPTEFLSSSTSLRTTEPATTTTEPTPTRLITAILPQPTESIIIPSSEIPQTTTSLPNAETTISRSTTVILQPRPFGYPRRTRPSTTVSTTGPGRKTTDMKISKLPTLRELIERYLVDDSENFLEKMISTRIFNNKSSDIIIEPELMDVESNLNENNRIKGDDQTVAESELLRINDGDLISKIGILRSPSHDESKEENSTDEMSVYRSTLGTTRTSGGSTRDRLHTSVKKTAFDEPERRIVTIKARETNDQSGRAQEMAVSVAEAPTSVASIESGRETSSRFRGVQRHQHRVRTKSELPTRTVSPVRRRQRPPAVELTSSRAPRPAILDYDYYDSDDVGLSVRPELKNKIYITRGRIGCLDQGNFAHPTSCKKFITCAKMVNGQVIATEYTCPAKLSFDPVGGICNWSAGLGCKEQSFNS